MPTILTGQIGRTITVLPRGEFWKFHCACVPSVGDVIFLLFIPYVTRVDDVHPYILWPNNHLRLYRICPDRPSGWRVVLS